MALSLKSNKLPLILLGVMVVFALTAVFRSGSEPPAPAPMTAVPLPGTSASAPGADADTPQDTLRTLTSELKQVRKSLADVSTENAELRERNERILRDRNQTVEEVTQRVTQQMSHDSGAIGGLAGRLASLEARLSGADTVARGSSAAARGEAGIPAGFGYEGGGGQEAAPGGTAGSRWHNGVVWVEPMGRSVPAGASGAAPMQVAFVDPLDALPPTGAGPLAAVANAQPGAGTSGTALQAVLGAAGAPAGGAQGAAVQAALGAAGLTAGAEGAGEPFFTIPENATLIGSTTMTALIGRVPVNGKVTDPVPFKALIGRPNLAANGFEVPPEIVGMVVSGKAVGDWTLSCVYGNVESVTFLFADGTIRTVSNRRSGNALGGLMGDDRIAWLSDDRGVPCISGNKITNAPAWIATQVGVKTLGIAAEAVAAAQTTTSTSSLTGGATTSVTGDQSKYIVGRSASGAADELSNWITSRMSNSFDAVFVPAGAKVALHLDRAIELDKMPDARRLDYRGMRRQAGAYRARLD